VYRCTGVRVYVCTGVGCTGVRVYVCTGVGVQMYVCTGVRVYVCTGVGCTGVRVYGCLRNSFELTRFLLSSFLRKFLLIAN